MPWAFSRGEAGPGRQDTLPAPCAVIKLSPTGRQQRPHLTLSVQKWKLCMLRGKQGKVSCGGE